MPVEAVRKAAAILKAFTLDEPLLGVSELSRRLGLHKSTVHGLVVSLEREGLLEQDPQNRKYRLGIGLLELAYTLVYTHDLVRVAHPYLHYLADSLEEAAYLALQDEDKMLNLVQVSSSSQRGSVRWIPRAPLHCTAAGKIFLAHVSEDELSAYIDKGLVQRTAKSVTDPTDLRRELDRVREQGFATSCQELQESRNAIAVPVTRPEGTLIAAVAVVGRAYSWTSQKAMGALEMMRGVATEISHKLAAAPEEHLGSSV